MNIWRCRRNIGMQEETPLGIYVDLAHVRFVFAHLES